MHRGFCFCKKGLILRFNCGTFLFSYDICRSGEMVDTQS